MVYFCSECGTIMERDDDVLICPNCEHSVDVEDYGHEESFLEEIPDIILGMRYSDSDDDEDEDNEYREYYDPEMDE